MIKSTGREKWFKSDKEGDPASHFPESNNKDVKKKEHKRSDNDKSRASISSKSSKSDISKIKRKMKKTFTTMEANIDELGYEDSDLTSSESEDRSVNSHVQFHNKP